MNPSRPTRKLLVPTLFILHSAKASPAHSHAGLPTVQYLIACSMQKLKAWERGYAKATKNWTAGRSGDINEANNCWYSYKCSTVLLVWSQSRAGHEQIV